MLILDSHCDTPSQIIRLRDLTKDNGHAHVDFPKLRAGNVDASFFSLYTPCGMEPDAATRYALEMIAGTYDAVAAAPDMVAMAFSPEDILSNKAKGLTSILLGMENGAPIQKSLPLLRLFHRMGVRYVTLTHNGDNEIGDAAAQGRRWHGLSPFGREAVAEMNRLGMMIDVAHCSDETFYDCLECASSPIVSTHSCCRSLASHRRNMTDDMIRRMADKGGVIQINFYPYFLTDGFSPVMDELLRLNPDADKAEAEFIADPSNPEKIKAWHSAQDMFAELPRPDVGKVVDHIDHAVKTGGIEAVGIGSDFDGIEVTPSGLENISKVGVVFDEMARRGYTDDEIEKVAGANFMRVFRDNQRL